MRWAALWILLLALVLVPFVLFESPMNAIAASATAGHLSTSAIFAGVVALLAVDVLLPIPSSIVATAAGVLLGVWRGAAAIWIGMTIGAIVGYAFGARASGAAARLVGPEGLARAAGLADRYGDWALVMCRPVPVLAEASVIFAGLVGARYRRYLLIVSAANLGIAVGYASFGAFSMRADSFLVAFLGALVLPALVIAISKLFDKR